MIFLVIFVLVLVTTIAHFRIPSRWVKADRSEREKASVRCTARSTLDDELCACPAHDVRCFHNHCSDCESLACPCCTEIIPRDQRERGNGRQLLMTLVLLAAVGCVAIALVDWFVGQ